MTPSEAVERIKEDGIKCRRLVRPDILRVACEALEKQVRINARTTDKPCHVKALDIEFNEVVTFECYPCPACGKYVHANISYHYCEHCGQALDWSEMEDKNDWTKA